MLPWILLAAGLIAGDAAGKASAKKAIEKPVYKVTLVHKAGSTEAITGGMLQAWGAAVEREVSLRGSADPVTSMTMEAGGKIIRSWVAPGVLQGWPMRGLGVW